MIYSYEGSIKIITPDGVIIRNKRYFDRVDRQRYLDDWRSEIGIERFKLMAIQIAPIVKTDPHTEAVMMRKIERTNKKKIPCQQIRLNTFMLQTSAQYKTQR
jgi:hypothetical protein